MNNKATHLTSQAQNTKNLTTKAFEPARTDVSHLISKRGACRDILEVLIYRQSKPTSNEYIAKRIKRSERTVKRWTAYFDKMGIIDKDRQHLYAFNSFNVNLSKSETYQLRVNGYSKDKKSFLSTHGMTPEKYLSLSFRPETVTLSYSSSKLDSYITIPTHPVRASRTHHIQAREEHVTIRHTFKHSVNFGFLSKKEEAMEAYNPINQVIRDIKSIKLTKWGQIRLMAYPDRAISFAEQQMQYANMASVKDPFKLFAFHCSDWCRKNDEKPNWEVVSQLEAAYKAPEDRTYVLFSAKPSPVNQPSKESQKRENRCGTSPMTAHELAKLTQRADDEIVDLLRQIHHFDDMITNPDKYLKPNPFFTLESWVEHTKKMRQQKVDRLIDLQKDRDGLSHPDLAQEPVGDKMVPTDVVSPLASSEGEARMLHEGGEGYVVSDEVCDSPGAYTVEEGWDEYTPEIVLRPTENGQISMWDRTSTPAWRGT